MTFPGGATRNSSYDDQGRLSNLTNLTSGSLNLATYAYGYDFNYANSLYDRKGQRVSMTATVPAQSLSASLFKYKYDSSYQLTKVTYPNVAPFSGEVDSWTYDGIGNRTSSTVNSTTANYTYQKIGANPLNWQRLLSDGTNSYTYMENGATQSRTGYSFTWDHELRLTDISGTSSYKYDYQGRRTSRTVGSTTNTYLFDGLNLIQEQGATSADYLFGPGIDEPLAMSRGGQIYYYVVDGLGSVTEVTNSAGAVQNAYLYDAWGQTRSQTGSLGNPFGYTAREVGEAGTMFYRARYYQPSIGRFLSEDPNPDSSGRESDISQYVFVLSDPVNLLDPTGLSWVTFDRGSSTVTVYDGSGNVRFSCSACNTTTNPAGDPNTPESNGPIPPGVFPVGAPRSNASGARYRTYFNGEGICFFPIEHPRRPGLGIHSHGGGRVKDQATGRIVPRQDSSPTQGCIRVPQECLGKMTQVPQSDPIIGLTVK